MNSYIRLVHKNPKLNEKHMWYRLIDITSVRNVDWYLATIWGPNGMISSTVHAVPRDEYDEQVYRTMPKPSEVVPESIDDLL